MFHIPSVVVPSVIVAALAALPSATFRDIDLDQALIAAQREERIVLVDWFTTWCAPCKRLDATTWKDAEVQSWIAETCVALKIDAEKEVERARRHRIDAYPTLQLLRPDGTEIDRIVGYRDAATFLSEARAALAGKDSLTRAREALVGREDDVDARRDLGRALKQKGRYAEALAEYLWCFDHGRATPGYAGVRLSFLLKDIASLAGHCPAALDELARRRDAAEARLVAGSASFEDAADALALNRALKAKGRALALYEKLVAQGPLPAQMKPLFARDLVTPLHAARRYADVLALVDDPMSHVEEAVRLFERANPVVEGAGDAEKKEAEETRAMMRSMVVLQGSCLYEALVATARAEPASAIAARLIRFDPSVTTHVALIRAASRAERPDLAAALVDRALETLGEDERDVVRRAAERAARTR